jgi:hypothetical protein
VISRPYPPVVPGRVIVPFGRAAGLPVPALMCTTGIKLAPLEPLEKLSALVPLPHLHLVRYGGILAPHSKLRAEIVPTSRQ